MSNYTKTTDFAAKDSLPTGDAGKIIRGAEFGTEFDNIATAIATKADTAGPTLTGTTTFDTLSDGTIGVTAFVDEDDMSSDSATMLPTQQSVKAYVDSQTTAQDLDFEADTGGPLSIDLDSETLTLTGGTGVDTSGAGNAVTFAIDSTVATLTGTQTLTNKTLTSADIDTPDIDGGTIDGTVIGGTTAAAVSATTVSATGNITVDGTVDGRDVATDGTKLDTVETNADVTDTTNVTAAGALMDSEVTNLDQVKAFDSADYATAAQGTTADNALPKTGGAMTGAITTNSTFDGRDVATDGTKLDGIEALADVTDTTNVTAAGALMDSELTNLTAVKSLDQGVATTDSPTFAGLTTTADVSFGDNDKAIFGASSDLEIYHDGTHSRVDDTGTGKLILRGNDAVEIHKYTGEYMITAAADGAVTLYHDDSSKLATTSTGIDVTGTLVSDGLTVDGDASVAGTVGVTADNGTITTGKDSASSRTHWSMNNPNGEVAKWDSNGTDLLHFITDEYKVYTAGNKAFEIDGNGDISFYEDTGTTAKLFWDASAESLGIGTSSPVRPLSVKGSQEQLTLSEGDARGATFDYRSSTGNLNIATNGINARTNPQFTLDLNGNVGIGTSSPDANLEVIGNYRQKALDGNSQGFNLTINNTTDVVDLTNYYNAAMTFGTNNTERMRIDSSGNVGIGNSSPSTFNQRVTAPHLVVGAGNNSAGLTLYSGTNSQSSINFALGTTTTQQYDGGIVYHPSSYMGFHTNNGAERMRIDSSGNVGIGVTPSSWSSAFTALQIEGSSVWSTGGDVALAANNYYNGTQYKYVNNGAASRQYHNTDGSVAWFQAGSGTAGATISFTQAMTLDASGNLLVGTTSASGASAPDNSATAGDAGVRISGDGYIGIGNNTNPALYLNIIGADGAIQQFRKDGTVVGSIQTNSGRLDIQGAGNTVRMQSGTSMIQVTNGTQISLETAGAERARIDSSGNVLVSKTSNDNSTAGVVLRDTGEGSFVASGQRSGLFNRLSSDGEIINFRKDSTPVGSISSHTGGFLKINTAGDSSGLLFGTSAVYPIKNDVIDDDAVDLGDGSNRFRDLHLSGRVEANGVTTTAVAWQSTSNSTSSSKHFRFKNPNGNVGDIRTNGSATAYITSSDYRLKENVVAMSGATERLKQLKPSRFNFIADADTTVDGFLAHEVADIVPEAIAGEKDAVDADGNPDYQGIDQSKLVPLLVATIQELEARIAVLESN